MNERARALNILQEARDTLANRLAQKILESEQEILADAAGDSFLSEIESIYDQLGGRLAHVTSMMSSLPSETDDHPLDATPPGPLYTDVAAAYSSGGEANPTAPPAALALPGPHLAEERLQLAAPATFQAFAAQVQQGDIDGAGRSLAELFGVDGARGRRSAEWFVERLSAHPDLYHKAARIRHELGAGRVALALVHLGECFGLEGLESLPVLQHLRRNGDG